MKNTYRPAPGSDAKPELASCQGSLEELHQYIDGWLARPEADRLKAHIDSCADCDEIYRFQVELKKLVGANCRAELPDDLRRRVLKALEE